MLYDNGVIHGWVILHLRIHTLLGPVQEGEHLACIGYTLTNVVLVIATLTLHSYIGSCVPPINQRFQFTSRHFGADTRYVIVYNPNAKLTPLRMLTVVDEVDSLEAFS